MATPQAEPSFPLSAPFNRPLPPIPFVNSAPAAPARPFINPLFKSPKPAPLHSSTRSLPRLPPPFINPFAQPAPVAAPPLARRSFCHLTDAQLLNCDRALPYYRFHC
eukprot:gnl/Ergobibamus_cyprinoides/5472.p2 GENE.gnl/Ergobibamus_cyprinoides/5472~~gnl/Ergobibamus_cyprinoides/5472.p2  ORF type:complete len:107 (+),score=0.34 gnl/Ergobibamus_cyprinoides/5472:412-732(+)